MKLLICTLLLVFCANLDAQEPAKLTPELELKRQILQLQLTLKSERDRNAQLTIAYGSCTAEALKGVDTQGLMSKFKAEVEAANPDQDYNVETGVLTPKPKKP